MSSSPRAASLAAGIAAATVLAFASSCVSRAHDERVFRMAIRGLDRAPEIRVLVAREQALVAIDGPYRVRGGPSLRDCGGGSRLAACQAHAAPGGGVAVGGTTYAFDRVLLVPESPDYGLLRIGETRYRGSLAIVRTAEEILLVNVLNLEWYVAGVVGEEMPLEWPPEALRAQAVAARTYAHYMTLHRSGDPGGRVYDVVATTQDQKYGGMRLERTDQERRTLFQEAVFPTQGCVLGFAGEILCTYYHSTCGGCTEPAHEVHGGTPVPPLCGVACRTCRASPLYRWQARLSAPEMEAALGTLGARVGRLTGIEGIGPGPDRRNRRVRLTGTEGSRTIDVDRFRAAVNEIVAKRPEVAALRRIPDKPYLHSNAFVATGPDPQGWRFAGRGWAHGAGMCQYGACGLAREGTRWRDILGHYYPGCDVAKLY